MNYVFEWPTPPWVLAYVETWGLKNVKAPEGFIVNQH